MPCCLQQRRASHAQLPEPRIHFAQEAIKSNGFLYFYLNSSFKDFYEFYTNQAAKSTEPAGGEHKVDELRNYKTDEEMKAERRAKIEAMKPVAAGTLLLLILLILLPKPFH